MVRLNSSTLCTNDICAYISTFDSTYYPPSAKCTPHSMASISVHLAGETISAVKRSSYVGTVVAQLGVPRFCDNIGFAYTLASPSSASTFDHMAQYLKNIIR